MKNALLFLAFTTIALLLWDRQKGTQAPVSENNPEELKSRRRVVLPTSSKSENLTATLGDQNTRLLQMSQQLSLRKMEAQLARDEGRLDGIEAALAAPDAARNDISKLKEDIKAKQAELTKREAAAIKTP